MAAEKEAVGQGLLTPLNSGDAVRAPLSPYSCCPLKDGPQSFGLPKDTQGQRQDLAVSPGTGGQRADSQGPAISPCPGVPSVVHLAPGPQLTRCPGGGRLLRWVACAQACGASSEQVHRPESRPQGTVRRQDYLD